MSHSRARSVGSPHEQRDMRGACRKKDPGFRFAHPGYKLSEGELATAGKIIRQRPRLIVLGVARRIEQRHGAAPGQRLQPLDRVGIAVELLRIALTELRPSLRTMTEPFAQRRAGGDVLEPDDAGELVFADPARPDAVDQHPLPVAAGAGLVDAFDPQPRGALASFAATGRR